MRPNILSILAKRAGFNSPTIKDDALEIEGPSADYYGDTSGDFGNSKYDEQTSTALLTKNNELDYLRGEKQSNWDKFGNGLYGMAGKTLTTAAEGIINPFYGTIAALGHTDKNGKWDPSMNSYYNNDFTKVLDNINTAVEESNPFYANKKESADQGLAKLWHANTIFRDILSGAGTTIGAALTGAAWSKTLSAAGKAMAVAQTPAEAAVIIEEIKAGAVEGVKEVAKASTKKLIKDGVRQGTIALMSATGEAGAEARETQKNIYHQLTHDASGNQKQMTQSELDYAESISKQAGDMAFGMNLPVIMADNWFVFGKTMFGNKADDAAKIISKGSIYNEAVDVFEVAKKSKYADAAYRAKKILTPMVSEGNQEILQFGIGKTAEDYYKKKYYNPSVTDFLDSFTKGMAEAYTSQEGLHAGIIGALSAGITSPGITLATQGKKGFKEEYITNPEDAIVAKGVDMLNTYKSLNIRKKFIDNLVRSTNLTEDKDKALDDNNDFNYYNANEDMIFSYVYNRLVNGKLEDTKKELENFKDLTVEELEESYGIKINEENRSAIEGITVKGGVREFVESRLEKIAKIEKTHNQITALFPHANPDVKELLAYSVQGLENSKNRRSSLNKEIASMLPKEYSLEDVAKINNDPNAILKSLSFNPTAFGITYNSLTSQKKELFKKQVQASSDISPIHKDEILKKLTDLELLKEREVDFTLTYNALKNPENAAQFLNASKALTAKYIEISTREEQSSTEPTPNESEENTEENPSNNTESTENVHVIPTTKWYDDSTTEESLTESLKEAIKSKEINQVKASEIFNEWINEKSKKDTQIEQASQEVLTTKTKGVSQSVLRTETKNRDSNFTNFEGKTITLGELRAKFALSSFIEIQGLLKELINSGKDVNKYVKFTVVPGTDGERVVLNLTDDQGNFYPVSIIERYGLGKNANPEEKIRFQEVIDMFYNENGPKDVEEINEMHNKGVINIDLKSMLNYTTGNVDINGDFIDSMISFDTLNNLLLENGTDNYVIKDGNRELTDATNGEFTAFEEDNSDIREGFHMVVEGVNQPIKLRLAPFKNVSQLIDNLASELQDLIANNASTADIQAAVKIFNDQIFFALKPKDKSILGLRLVYDEAPNRGLYFRKSVLSKEDPEGERNYPYILDKVKVAEINNKYSDKAERNKALSELAKSEGSMLTNINPEDLSLQYIIDGINASNLTLGVRPFKAEDIKYNSPFNENKELESSRFIAPIGEEGLIKHNIEVSVKAPISQPKTKSKSKIKINPTLLQTAAETLTTVEKPKMNAPVVEPEDVNQILNVPRGKNEDNDEVYSLNEKEFTGISEEEIEAIKAILPKFISIKDIQVIAKNLKVNGIPYGVFKNKVIYLNTSKGKPGTAYHEAFHAVFRTVLDEHQLAAYYSVAMDEFRKEGLDMHSAIDALVDKIPAYANKTGNELAKLVLEEYMADKFADFAQKPTKTMPTGAFAKLWFKIKQFFNNLINLTDLDVLFDNILKGSFVNATEVGNRFSNSTESVFKLLPRFTGGFFSAEQSRKFINTFASKLYKIKIGEIKDLQYYNTIEVEGVKQHSLKSDEEILDVILGERITELTNVGIPYLKSKFKSPEAYTAALTRLNDERRLILDEEKIYSGESSLDILKSAIVAKLNQFKFEEVEDDEALEYKEKFSSQEAWLEGGHDSLSKTIKSYIGFTTTIEIDEITGLEREVAIDEVAVYNGLIRLLADTSKDKMIAKLYYATRSNDNPNVKAFYDQVIKDLGIIYDPETNSVILPENQNKINIYNSILTAFDKSNIQMINTFQQEKKDSIGFGWMRANTKDTSKLTLEKWSNNLISLVNKGFGAKELAKIEKQIDIIAKKYYSASKISDMSSDVKILQDEFKKFGVILTQPYIEFSLLKQKESFKDVKQTQKFFTKDQLNILKIHEEVIPISWELFEPSGGFSLSKSAKDNILNLYKGKKVDSELTVIAENNSIFDETTANFSFINAEGERVYEIINKSDVISSVVKFNTTDFAESITGKIKRNSKGVIERDKNGNIVFEEGTATASSNDKVESKNFEFLKTNWLLNRYANLFNKGNKAGLNLGMLSGFVDTTIVDGKFKGGITFGKFDQRTYLLSALGLFYNNNKESGNVKYLFRQNESSGTAYVIELPKINVLGKNFNTVAEFFINQFTTEYNRIKREAKEFNEKGSGNLKGYNVKLSDRAFDFTEFQYLKDLLSTKGDVESMIIYNQIKNAAIEGNELSSEHLKQVLTAIGITSTEVEGQPVLYSQSGQGMLGINFIQFKNACVKNRISDFLPSALKEDLDNFLYQFYINDYMMSSAFNELLDGDYALSRKSKDELSKRHKGGIASGNSYGKGSHASSIIKAVKQKLTIKTIDGKLVTITNEPIIEKYYDDNGVEVDKGEHSNTKSFTTINGKEYELAEYKPNDAMSYSSQYHIIMGALRQGRVDEKTREIYKDLIQFTKRDSKGRITKKINIGDKNIPGYDNRSIQHLFDALASFNSKKTVVFDGLRGQYLKMSELGMVRSSISYIEDENVDAFVSLTNNLFELVFNDDFESSSYRETVKSISKLYKPVPGMEYWHNLAQQMDLHGIDHVATEDASKGATLTPEDSEATSYDLSKSKFEVSNESKRNQVETPTGKTEVTIGSQILGIITSEQKDEAVVVFQGKNITIGELKKIYYNSINNTRDDAFKKALRVIKDFKGQVLEYGKNNPGTIDITKLDEYVKRAVLNSGADASLTEFFDTPFNYNMVQKLVKAEQVVLAHFSKGVLAQKTNGDKVSLVSSTGIFLVKELSTGKIISHHEVVKNPSKYADKSKYSSNTKLRYNVKDPITGEVYSECMLSQQILTRHGLKIGDTITSEMVEVMKSLGYRIPTGDKQSALSLKVVSLLPDYYNGSGIFPDEIVYLSGADFDIDSEFIQMPYFWYKKSDPTIPIKYGTKSSLEDKWEGYKFYNINYNKDFKRIYKDGIKELRLSNADYIELVKAYDDHTEKITTLKENKKDIPKTLIESRNGISAKLKEFEAFIYEATSRELGLSETKDVYLSKGSPNAPVVSSNVALDAMITMLTNEHMVDIANGTTSTQELSDARDRLINQGFINTNESKIKSKNRIVHDIVGKFGDNVKNSEGSQGIGPVANKIQQFAFLMSKLSNGNREIVFNKDSFKFKLADTLGGVYKAKNAENKRIADQLNMILNMFTDNAKDPIAGTLNIKLELLGGMSEMIMQGMSFENAVKIINVPIIQEYGELIKTLNYGKKNKIEESFSKYSSQKEAIQRIIYGEKDEHGKYLKKFTDNELTDLKKDINPVNVSISQIEDILKGNINKGLQIEIFMQFLKISEQSDLMSDINTLLKLNQGLNVSFTELHSKLHKSIDNLNISEIVGTKKSNLSTVSNPHIDITPILKEDTNTLENIRRALFIDKQVGQKIFIEQTSVFKNELEKLRGSVNESVFNKIEDFQKISKAFLGQISSLGYKGWLNDLLSDSTITEPNKKLIQQRLDSLNYGLLFSSLNNESRLTLAKQLQVLQSEPSTKNNYFVRYVSSRIHDLTNPNQEKINYKFDYVESRSFTKESNETMSLLIDSVKELYSNKRALLDETTGLTARQFVDNMFNYLMVKDNMQFKNNSLSKFIPVGMFGQYSKMLDKMTNSFITNETFTNNFDLSELAYNFRKIYVTDINTPFGTVKFKELKPENQPEYLTENKQIHIKIKGKGDEFKTNFNRAVDTFKFETLLVPGKQSKPVLNIEFPQFMNIKIDGKTKTYELQTARNSDKLAGKVIGLEGTYKEIEATGVKGVSMFFAGTYEQALAITNQVNEEEKLLKEATANAEKTAQIETSFESADENLETPKKSLPLQEINDELPNISSEEDVELTEEEEYMLAMEAEKKALNESKSKKKTKKSKKEDSGNSPLNEEC